MNKVALFYLQINNIPDTIPLLFALTDFTYTIAVPALRAAKSRLSEPLIGVQSLQFAYYERKPAHYPSDLSYYTQICHWGEYSQNIHTYVLTPGV